MQGVESSPKAVPVTAQDSTLMMDEDPEHVDHEMKDEQIVQEKKDIFDGDIISQNFKGRIRQIISYTGDDGQQKQKEKVIDSFAAILVRVVGFKDVYEAWETQYKSAIDDFNEHDGCQIDSSKKVTTQAKQTEWLEQVPKVLCLQLNRLDYKNNELVKHKHKVEIEKTLYVDRFMFKNQQ